MLNYDGGGSPPYTPKSAPQSFSATPAASVDDLIKLAIECGFTNAGTLNPVTIRVQPEVRDACEQDKCKAFAKSWSCPPACGSMEECSKRIISYKSGLIVQTTVQLEDEFDYDSMQKGGNEHFQHLYDFSDTIRAIYPDSLVLGAGACRRCSTCNYPSPCREPKKRISSMESFGMIVSAVCTDNGIPYYYGKGTLTYSGCVLF